MDVRGTGWGGQCNLPSGPLEASGMWNKDVSFQPSNYRELLAILKCIQSFQHILQGTQVQVLNNNVTSVAYINHLGGTNPLMTKLMTTVFVTVQELKIDLSA